MKHSLLHSVLFLCLFTSAIFALDYEMVSFDPLPENAEELSRVHIEDFLSQRYSEETIAIGEAIPLYVNNNDIRILDFILELDGSEPCTFEKELNIHTSYWENYNKFQVYKDSLSGDIEALRQASLGNDLVYNELRNQAHNVRLLRNSISHILIAFVSGEPRIIGTHCANILLSTYTILNESQLSNFLGFGFIPTGCPDVYIGVLIENYDGNIEWLWNKEFTLFVETQPICNVDPLKWSFFSHAFADRGKEDLPPDVDLGYKHDIYSPLPEIDMAGTLDCYPTVLCMRYLGIYPVLREKKASEYNLKVLSL